MADYFRITEGTLHWFLPLLPQSEVDALKNMPDDVVAIGASCEKCACGILVFKGGEIVDIRYIAVAEKYRRQGVATGMIDFLCRHMWESATPVTCTFAAQDRLDPMYSLFNSMWNFSIGQEEGFSCRIPLSALAESKTLAPLKKRSTAHPSFFSLTPLEQKNFFQQMHELGNIYLNEIKEEQYKKDLCLCETDKSDVKAAIFVTQEEAPDMELVFAWCAQGWQKTLIELLAQAGAQIPAGAEGFLSIAAVTPFSAAIVEKLLPERELLGNYYRAVWDMEL